jgi:hypothetical protein
MPSNIIYSHLSKGPATRLAPNKGQRATSHPVACHGEIHIVSPRYIAQLSVRIDDGPASFIVISSIACNSVYHLLKPILASYHMVSVPSCTAL